MTTTYWTDTATMLDAPPERAWRLAAAVRAADLPQRTLGERGVLRFVTADDQSRVHVCLAALDGEPQDAVRADLVDALTLAGFLHVDVEFEVSVPRQR